MAVRALTEMRVEAQRVLNAVRSALRIDGDLLSEDERIAIDSTAIALEKAMVGDSRVAIGAVLQALNTATREFADRRVERGIRGVLAGARIDDFEDAADESRPEDQQGP